MMAEYDVKIELPVSKSILIRAMALEYVDAAKEGRAFRPLGEDLPAGISYAECLCDDTTRFAEALPLLSRPGAAIEIGDGATPLRFLMAIAAAIPGVDVRILLSPQLGARPHMPLVDALRRLGADISLHYRDREGKNIEAIAIKGRKLRGGRISTDPSVSSQFASALTIISSLTDRPLELEFVEGKKRVSAPYLEMTRRMAEAVAGGANAYSLLEYDWSSASYFYEWALLNPGRRIVLPRMLPSGDSLQGDSVLHNIFASLGVESTFLPDSLVIKGRPRMKFDFCHPVEIDFTDTPDLLPAVACALCIIERPFCFTGVDHLLHKETNRLEMLKEELDKIDRQLEIKGSCATGGLQLVYTPEYGYIDIDKLEGLAEVGFSSHGDHRIAMALAPFAGDNLSFSGKDAVAKSFPGFWGQFAKLRNLKTP